MNSTLTALLNNSGHTTNESIYNGYGQTNWKLFIWKNLSSIEAAVYHCTDQNFSIFPHAKHFIAMFAISIRLVKKLGCGSFIALEVKGILLIITL
jgi:hypothetical protein